MKETETKVDWKILATIIAVVVAVCFTVGSVCIDNNVRQERVESIRVEKQHEIEVTRQKLIEFDKSRKRKIWEREMSPKDGGK